MSEAWQIMVSALAAISLIANIFFSLVEQPRQARSCPIDHSA